MPEAARAEAATKNLMKSERHYHYSPPSCLGRMRMPSDRGGSSAALAEGDVAGDGDTTEPAGVEELRVIYSAWANANRDLTCPLVGAETPEE